VTLVPASQARRIARRSSSTSPPHTPCEPMPAQTAMACAAWSRALATPHFMGNQASGSTRELATAPAGTRGRPVHGRSGQGGSRRTRRGLEAISPGCTSCPSASFIARSSPRPRRPHLPVRLVEEAVRDARGAGHGAEHHVPFRPFRYRTDRMRRTGRSACPSSGPRRTLDGLEVLARRPAPGSGWTRSSGRVPSARGVPASSTSGRASTWPDRAGARAVRGGANPKTGGCEGARVAVRLTSC
jgi:hypothetical protein